MASKSAHKFKDTDMQSIIGWVLRVGVFASMLTVFIGGVIYLSRHGHETANFHLFKGIPQFIQTEPGIVDGILHLRGRAIIQAGIVLLIATPIMRIIFSAVGFVLERDYLYISITIIVLTIIFFSMMTGYAG